MELDAPALRFEDGSVCLDRDQAAESGNGLSRAVEVAGAARVIDDGELEISHDRPGQAMAYCNGHGRRRHLCRRSTGRLRGGTVNRLARCAHPRSLSEPSSQKQDGDETGGQYAKDDEPVVHLRTTACVVILRLDEHLAEACGGVPLSVRLSMGLF